MIWIGLFIGWCTGLLTMAAMVAAMRLFDGEPEDDDGTWVRSPDGTIAFLPKQ